MTIDKIEHIDGATIQHGMLSKRIYLMHLADAEPIQLTEKLEILAKSNGYTKIFAKVPASSLPAFKKKDYIKEAEIPYFFKGRESAVFLGRFFDHERQKASDEKEIRLILDLSLQAHGKVSPSFPDNFNFRKCRNEDTQAMSRIYSTVFPTYPFPIDNPGYLHQTMQSHILYFGAEHDRNLVALASSEMDRENENVEMTDFATLPSWRGHSLAALLLDKMESSMHKKGMKTAYTIARALSPGINITFAKAGYTFSGTLTNNTNISGSIESMNVWHKTL